MPSLITTWRKSKYRLSISRNIESLCIEKQYRDRLGKLESGMLWRIGLRPASVQPIPLNDLFMQYRPEWHVGEHYHLRYNLADSYSVQLLEAYKDIGWRVLEPAYFRRTAFFNWWSHIDGVGFRYDWYDYPSTFPAHFPAEKIRRKAIYLINLFEKIHREGYCTGAHKGRVISIVEAPFASTRFNDPISTDGYEIWSGHHRAACLYALGKKVVTAVVLRDRRGPVK
jgi:hypothetical protein